MAKKKKSEVMKVGDQLPAYMRDEPRGDETIGQYVIPPRLKIVQRVASDELLAIFSAGDVIIVPNNLAVAVGTDEAPASFRFVPLFFFPEWCTWSPIELRGQENTILARSLDPTSDIAQKAKNPGLRSEQHPRNPNLFIKHAEHLNFIISLRDHDLAGEPIVMSFVRAEHQSGSRLCSLIKMRKAPIYGCVFEATVGKRSNAKGQWHGLNLSNPANNQWVPEEEFAAAKAVHLDFVKLHEESRVRVAYETPPNEDDGGKDSEF